MLRYFVGAFDVTGGLFRVSVAVGVVSSLGHEPDSAVYERRRALKINNDYESDGGREMCLKAINSNSSST